MGEFRCIHGILIAISIISFGVYLAYDFLAPEGDNLPVNYEFADVYPTTIDHAKNLSSPIVVSLDSTNVEWALFAYQGLIVLYLLVLLFKRDSNTLLCPWFYMFWSLACLGEISYLTALFRRLTLPSFFLLSLTTIFRHVAFGFACYGLRRYMICNIKTSQFHVFCMRYLVLNGLLFKQAWSGILLTMHLAGIMTRSFTVTPETARYAGLAILTGISVSWFLVQNFIVERYVRFTFAGLAFMVIFSVSWVLEARRNFEGSVYFKLCVAFLVLNGTLLILRGILVFINETKEVATTSESTEKIEI